MIEEIKKEILEMNSGILKDIVLTKEVFKILDKYNNQPDFKSAWNELKETIYKDSSDTVWLNETTTVIDEMEILEQKYKLGGE